MPSLGIDGTQKHAIDKSELPLYKNTIYRLKSKSDKAL
jgi:hypothetical protein